MTTLLQTFNTEMAEAVTRARQSLVQLTNGRRGAGAGVIWYHDGLILTNAHVTGRHAPQVTLWDGRSYPSRLLAYDEARDLAALAIDETDLPAIPLADEWRLAPGAWVLALGHPFGVAGAVSAGSVIGVGVPPEIRRYPGELIQVGLQLRPGHSGGPMLDGDGRLVGLNTMIAGPQVGLAIPLPVIKSFLAERWGGNGRVI